MANVLVVDDSAVVMHHLKTFFKQCGHNVVAEASNGVDAFCAYEQFKPDLVTMDCKMPIMDGTEAVKKIIGSYPDAKIIMISGEGQEDLILDCMKSGAKYFVVKPLQHEQMMKVVKSILNESSDNEKESEMATGKDEMINNSLVLAIDDSQVVLKTVSVHLKNFGHNIVTAESGEDGLNLASTGNPDLILLDVIMPGMDGFDVLEHLRGDDTTKNIPVIMLTDETKKESIQKAMEYGVVDYISKQFDLDAFKQKINSAIWHSKVQNEELESKRLKHISVSREPKRTFVTFESRLTEKEVIEETKVIFNKGFITMTKNDAIILDFHKLSEMQSDEVEIIKNITDLFTEREMHIVAGRHYGMIISEASLEDRIHLYISMGDLELYLNEQNDDK